MTIIESIILGLVEGITEYLPISSTGHLILTQALLGLNTPDEKSSADAFAIVIQGGAILAVLGLYSKSVGRMIRGLLGKDIEGRRLFINIVIAFLPAAILGPLLDDYIERYLFSPVPVLAALAVGGVWMIWIDFVRRRRDEKRFGYPDTPEHHDDWIEHGKTIHDITPLTALKIGLFQCVAMWPGTSRSMMTIAGGTMLGLRPKDAAEFSFLLGLPTLGGACVYKLTKNLMESSKNGTPNLLETFGYTSIIVGIVVAMVSAAIAVKWLVAFLNKHGLAAFGYYRLVLTAVLTALILLNIVDLSP